jgi:tRNA threonylcarbamoyl adenosine modification protein YjeE
MRTCSLSIAAEADLAPLARALAAALPDRAFVALAGDLGAGKTTFVKAFAAAVGIDPAEVVSPTFGLVHEHPSSAGILLHADMYRLGGTDDLHEVGWPDAVARARWVFVEWPERIAAALPAERIDLTIGIESPAARALTFTGRGAEAAASVRRLAASAPHARG